MIKIKGGISIRCDTEEQLNKAKEWLASINYSFRDSAVTVYNAPCRIYFHVTGGTYDTLPYSETSYHFDHFYELDMPKDEPKVKKEAEEFSKSLQQHIKPVDEIPDYVECVHKLSNQEVGDIEKTSEVPKWTKGWRKEEFWKKFYSSHYKPSTKEAYLAQQNKEQRAQKIDTELEKLRWEPQIGDWCYTDEFGIKLFKVLKVAGRRIYNNDAGWVYKDHPSFRKATPEEIASVQKLGIDLQKIDVEEELNKAWNNAMYTLAINEITNSYHSISTHQSDIYQKQDDKRINTSINNIDSIKTNLIKKSVRHYF